MAISKKSKLLKTFKGKFIQFKADGIIISGKLADEDDSYLYFADDEDVIQIALPKSASCVLLSTEANLFDLSDMEEMFKGMDTKKDDMQ